MVGSVLYMVYMEDNEVFDLRCIKLNIYCSVGFIFKTNKQKSACQSGTPEILAVLQCSW